MTFRRMLVAVTATAMMLVGAATAAGADTATSLQCQSFQEGSRSLEYTAGWIFSVRLAVGETLVFQTSVSEDSASDDIPIVAMLYAGGVATGEVVDTVEGVAGETFLLEVTDPDTNVVKIQKVDLSDVTVRFDVGVDCIPASDVVDDADGDGVLNDDDLCPDTDVEKPGDLKNRFRVADLDSGDFIDTNGDSAGVALQDTAGCNAAQIIEAMDLGRGHVKFGITFGELDAWIASL